MTGASPMDLFEAAGVRIPEPKRRKRPIDWSGKPQKRREAIPARDVFLAAAEEEALEAPVTSADAAFARLRETYRDHGNPDGGLSLRDMPEDIRVFLPRFEREGRCRMAGGRVLVTDVSLSAIVGRDRSQAYFSEVRGRGEGPNG